MTSVEFERPFKINLNSILLVVQLAGVAIACGMFVRGTGAEVEKNAASVTTLQRDLDQFKIEVRSAIGENRTELRAVRALDTAIAGIKADVDNVKTGINRIERSLEQQPRR